MSGYEDEAYAFMRAIQDMSKRPRPEAPSRGEMIEVINSDSFEAVEKLLERGMNPNDRLGSGITALMIAVRDKPESVRALLKGGANPNLTNTRGETALMMAIQSGGEEIVDLLLDAGANTNVHDQFGNTPLTRAMEGGPRLVPIVRLLLRAGANPNNHAVNQLPPLLRAVSNNPEFIVPLLNAGADVDVVDAQQQTPLMQLLRYRIDLEPVLKMIKMSKNIDAKNGVGKSALVIAATNRNAVDADKIMPVLQALMMDAKADPTVLMDYKEQLNKAAKDYFMKGGYREEVSKMEPEYDIDYEEVESSEAAADVEHKFDEQGKWVPRVGDKITWRIPKTDFFEDRGGYASNTEPRFGIVTKVLARKIFIDEVGFNYGPIEKVTGVRNVDYEKIVTPNWNSTIEHYTGKLWKHGWIIHNYKLKHTVNHTPITQNIYPYIEKDGDNKIIYKFTQPY